jgi:hypothetical protein
MSFCLGLVTAAITLIFKNNANQEVLVVLNTLLRAMALFCVADLC